MMTKAPTERRTHQVKVLFNEAEYQRLTECCKASGRMPATYCRLRALEWDGRSDQAVVMSSLPSIPTEFKRLDSQLGHLGGNLNQIAHHLNLDHVMDSVDAAALLVSVHQLHGLIIATQSLIRSTVRR